MQTYDYIRDGAAIYQRSFATIRAEADLSGFSAEQAQIVVRIIHACGMVEVAQSVRMTEDFVPAARESLKNPVRFSVIPRWWRTALPVRVCLRTMMWCVPCGTPGRRTVLARLAIPVPLRRWICGGSGWPGLLWLSGTRPRPCSIYWNCWMLARQSLRPLSVCLWVLWGRRNPRQHLKKGMMCPGWLCGGGWGKRYGGGSCQRAGE